MLRYMYNKLQNSPSQRFTFQEVEDGVSPANGKKKSATVFSMRYDQQNNTYTPVSGIDYVNTFTLKDIKNKDFGESYSQEHFHDEDINNNHHRKPSLNGGLLTTNGADKTLELLRQQQQQSEQSADIDSYPINNKPKGLKALQVIGQGQQV